MEEGEKRGSRRKGRRGKKHPERRMISSSKETRVIGVGLLHALKVCPADAAAKNKRKIDASSTKDVLAVLADVLIPDFTHVNAAVVQERAQDAQSDHTPDAEDCAAHRAYVFSKKREREFKTMKKEKK